MRGILGHQSTADLGSCAVRALQNVRCPDHTAADRILLGTLFTLAGKKGVSERRRERETMNIPCPCTVQGLSPPTRPDVYEQRGLAGQGQAEGRSRP